MSFKNTLLNTAGFSLRDYQTDAMNQVFDAWETGHRNVLLVLPTGAGKTVCFSHAIRRKLDEGAPSVAIAHRQELVSQMSLALAKNGVHHRIIAPSNVIRKIVTIHMKELGQSYYDPLALCAVAGVDTLKNRIGKMHDWASRIKLWVMDEGHHLLRSNKWGASVEHFPSAVGLSVTATPNRPDGKGLGRHASGVIDHMVVGPDMQTLIDRGYLTPFRIYCPQSTVDVSSLAVSKTTGDYKPKDVVEAVAHSSLVEVTEGKHTGDIVEHYLRLAKGKSGVTFVPDVATAEIVAQQFNDAGVPAAVIHAKTPDLDRFNLINQFRRRELLQLVNVDLFGEGFDLPAIEVVSMARPTASFVVYAQQFGRALRLLDGKPHAIIIDHVGNVYRHMGPPTTHRNWTLDDREKRGDNGPDDTIPMRTCLECTAIYERFLKVCPYCGAEVPEPTRRDGPEFVDGDLVELDAATMAALLSQVTEVDRDTADVVADYREELERKMCPKIGIARNVKLRKAEHEAQQLAVADLREAMAWYGGHGRADGLDDSAIHRRFYGQFGVDWLTAQTLSASEMVQLTERVKRSYE